MVRFCCSHSFLNSLPNGQVCLGSVQNRYLCSAMCEIALGRKTLLRWIVYCLYCLDMQCLQRWDISDLPHCSRGFGMLERKSSTQLLMAARSWLNYLHSTHHLSLGFLPPISNSNSSLLPQWISLPKIPTRNHLMLLCVCDPLHLVCLSPFPLLMGLSVLSLCQESAPHWALCFAGSCTALQRAGKAAICPRFSSVRLQAKSWGEHLPAPAKGEGAQKGFLFSCQWHRVPSKGKERECGVGQPAEIRSLQFGPSQLCWQVKMASPTPARQKAEFVI